MQIDKNKYNDKSDDDKMHGNSQMSEVDLSEQLSRKYDGDYQKKLSMLLWCL